MRIRTGLVRNTDPARAYNRPRPVTASPASSAPARGSRVGLRGAAAAVNRRRIPVALALVGVTGLTLTSTGTFALWTDSGNAQAGTFTAGTLDIMLDGSLSGAGGSLTRSDLALTNLVPGESKAVTVVVKNNGSSTFTYTVLGTGSGALASALQVAVVPGATASNGTSGTGFDTGSCSTGTPTYTNLSTTQATVSTAARTLTTTSTENSCVIVRLDPNAATGLQGASGSAVLSYSAAQLTS